MKGENIQVRMFGYLEHSKKLLQNEGYLLPTIFADTPFSTSLMILPISLDEGADEALDIAGKVLRSYNVRDYYVVSESYHIIEGDDPDRYEECINVIYAGGKDRKLMSIPYKKTDSGEYFFGEVLDIVITNISGSVLDLYLLKERVPKMNEVEKAQYRMLFPMRDQEEYVSGKKETVH